MRTKSSRSITAPIRDNESRICEVPGCGYHRRGLHPFCVDHLRRYQRYGHPNGKPMRPSLWAAERTAVSELLHLNADHAGLKSGLSWLSSWMAEAKASPRAWKGTEEIARLVLHAVTPLTVLTEVAALLLWVDRSPGRVPDDRAQDFAISRAVFSLSPRPRRQGGRVVSVSSDKRKHWSYAPKAKASALAHVGAHLRRSLAPLLATITVGVTSRAQQEAQRVAEMRAPMSWTWDPTRSPKPTTSAVPADPLADLPFPVGTASKEIPSNHNDN